MELFDYISNEDIFEAYRRLKNIFYYDNSALYAKYKLAEFECETLEDVGDEEVRECIVFELKNRIKDYVNRSNPESYISVVSIPKSVKEESSLNNAESQNQSFNKLKIFSNVRAEKFSIEKYNYLIDAPIEVYVLSVLWLMKVAPHYTHKISSDNYAYRFKIRKKSDEDAEDTLVDSITTFQPYFNGYKEWRDNALDAAHELLDKNNDATIVCLDIQRYFYSMNLDVSKLLEKFEDENTVIENKSLNILLTDILQDIHKAYTNIVEKKGGFEKYSKKGRYTMLPLGLPSSGIIANLFLAEFDNNIKEILSPEFYGRYVDDIIIVLKNKSIRSEDDFNKTFGICEYKSITGNNGQGVLCKDEEGQSYCIQGEASLKIQQEKVLIEHISHKGSYAVLNNFRNRLKEQSSEFNYLPDIELLSDFDDKSFDIGQEEGITKFRDIKNFKGNKFGVSKFLSNRILLIGLKIPKSYKEQKKEKEQILAFFSGGMCIDYYSLWIKVATYFVLLKDKTSLLVFYNNVKDAIQQLQNTEELLNFLHYSISIPLALTPTLLGKEKRYSELYNYSLIFRRSNMFPDYLVGAPLINYTYLALDEEIDLTEEFGATDVSFRLQQLAPRLFKFHEICLFEQLMNKTGCCDYNTLEYKYRFYNNFPDINAHNIFEAKLKQKDYNQTVYINTLETCVDWREKPKRKIAIANMRIPMDIIKRNRLKQQQVKIQEALDIFKVVNEAISKKVEILVLPEWCMPYQLLILIIKKCVANDIALITGMRYRFSNGEGDSEEAYNMVATILPIKTPKFTQALAILRQKKHLAPIEEAELKSYNYKIVPSNSPYIHFHWRNTYFTVYICFELADVIERSLFKSEIDMLIAPVANKDTTYYDDIAGTVVRDLHCYYVQANTSEWGDSRITAPTSHVDRDIIRVKGGTNATILVEDIDIRKLREFEMMEYSGQAKSKSKTQSLKFTPPNFDRSKTLKRIHDESLC